MTRSLSRREVLEVFALTAAATACRHVAGTIAPPHDALAETTYGRVRDRARSLAAEAYRARPDDLPPELRDIGYLTYQDIAFKPEASIPLGDRFGLQLFHRGHFHKGHTDIVVQPRLDEPQAITYDASRFAFGPDLAGVRFDASLGHAGFRVHVAKGKDPARFGEGNEFLVFLDAAYFRLRGLTQSYGLSGRGLAIDTDSVEEFPDFTAFWIVEPEPGALALDIVALLDSPSVTGAFWFRAEPGNSSTLAVRASTFARRDVKTFGLAPLTSMFVHGSNGPVGHFDDFRPEVHDSDGLFLQTRTEPAAWRPLINGRAAPRTSRFATPGLERYALLQRQRDFAQYIDTRARYEDRPGVVVELGDGFPESSVRLYEIPSPEEYMDNIVAYAVPEKPLRAGDALEMSYTMRTVGAEPVSPLAHVVWTRIGSADRMRFVDPPIPGRRIYFVDWVGESLPRDPEALIVAEVTASTGTVVDPILQYVEKTGGWRVYFEHRPDGEVSELRATLHLSGRQIAETWLYGT